MSTLEQSAKGKKDGDIRYLTPLNIDTNKTKKYCRFKKSGIKYIDYKDADFLLKFVNEQGKILPRRLTGTSLKYQRKVSVAVKRARFLALIPYSLSHEVERGFSGEMTSVAQTFSVGSLKSRRPERAAEEVADEAEDSEEIED
jgi:small subunit ribosomal protein S18